MEIIEKEIIGKKTNQAQCEDGLFIGEHFIAVIDGVTSKGKTLWQGQTSGVYAKNIIMYFLENAPFDITAEKLIEGINQLFLDEVKKKNVVDQINEHLRASIIVYSNYFQEIWSYGDCQCMINKKNYDHSKKVDILNANVRSFTIQGLIKSGLTVEELQNNDISRNLILPLLKLQHHFENVDEEFGYPVINGAQLNPKYIKSYKVNNGDEIILASDGYPKLFPNLKESESYLSYVLKEDPLCYSLFKTTKGLRKGNISFDDRTYIRFIV